MKKIKSIGTAVLLSAFLSASQEAISQNDHQTADTEFITVKNVHYAYRSFGIKTGIPLVFFQHFTGTMDNWDPALTDDLALTHHIILFDNKGIGSSEGNTPESINEMSEDAVGFITALGYKKADLLGFSVGGFVAQQIAIDHPELVHKLILAGTGPRGGIITDNTPVLENKEKFTPPQQILHLFFDESLSSQKEGLEFLQRISLRQKNRDTDTKIASILAQNKAIESYRDDKDPEFTILNRIEVPVLIVNGVHDKMVPAVNSYTLVSHIKNAKLVLYPDSGHGALFQYHKDFVKEVNKFLM